MDDISFWEFAWFCLAACGYIPVAAPVMMLLCMAYNKIVDMLVGEDEDEGEEG